MYSESFWMRIWALALSTPNSFSSLRFYSAVPRENLAYRWFSSYCSSYSSFSMSIFCFSIILCSYLFIYSSVFLASGDLTVAVGEWLCWFCFEVLILDCSLLLPVVDTLLVSFLLIVIFWVVYLDRVLSKILGSSLPNLTFSIFSIISCFCLSISFFIICLWSNNSCLYSWIC